MSNIPARAIIRPSRGVIIATLVVAALLAAEVSRLTVATAFAESRPELARRLAPQLPEVLVYDAMAQVGQSAAQGQPPPQSTMETLRLLSRVAPLRSEPLLVQAAIAHRGGDPSLAERLLLEARRRNPRSAAARYLLADVWLSQGRIEEGLSEMAILSRLFPESSTQLAPALSQYARAPGGAAQLARVVQANPQLKGPLLNALALDPDNAPIILEIAGATRSQTQAKPPPWQAALLKGLIRRGDYEAAYALWRRLAGFSGPRPLIFNEGFRPTGAPPPFNWEFHSSGAGVIEPGEGRMRVLFYGRDNAVLASQLLLLPPGAYRLAVGLSGTTTPGALSWELICVGRRRALMQLDLSSSGSAQAGFEVPANGCSAQILRLRGRALDMPKETDLLVGPISLQRSGR